MHMSRVSHALTVLATAVALTLAMCFRGQSNGLGKGLGKS